MLWGAKKWLNGLFNTYQFVMILRMYLWYLEKIWRKSAIPDTKNVSGKNLCRHDLAESAKSTDFWLSGRHVADMSATFPAKLTIGDASTMMTRPP